MSNVVQLTVHRQANEKVAFGKAAQAIVLQPTTPREQNNTRTAAPDEVSFGAAGRLLPMRQLQALGDHVALPPADAATTALGKAEPADQTEERFAMLFSELHGAHAARDAVKLERLASRHLFEVAAPAGLARLDPITRSIYQFFKAKGCGATAQELRNLIGSFPRKDLLDYLLGSAALMSQLKAQALAAMVNGTLSNLPVDLLFLMKAIVAFQIAVTAALNKLTASNTIPLKIICAVLDLPVTFPEWCFDIDPCTWHHQLANPAVAGAAQASPLHQRIERIAAATTKSEAANAVKGRGGVVQTGEGKDGAVDPCSCEGDIVPPCLPPDPCCVKVNYYVTDTLVLRDKTVRYVPSDLAYIENIVAGEERLREHTFTKTVEDYSEDETTTTKSEERDHQITEKSAIQNEIESNLKMSADMTAKYDSGPHSLEVNATISKDTAQKQAREQVREAVDKAVSKLQVETRKLSSRRVTAREEEKNSHNFINHSEDHVVAKYFYVSKEVEGQVLSHGVRTTVELLIPSPAALYEHLERTKLIRGFKMKKPAFPAPPAKWEDVDPAKYNAYMSDYQVEQLPSPPVPLVGRWIGVTIQGSADQPQPLQIPDGYTLTAIRIDNDPDLEFKRNQGGQVAISVGGEQVYYAHWRSGQDSFERVFGKDVNVQGPSTDATITITGGIKRYTVAFSYFVSPPATDYTEWKKSVFLAIKSKVDAANEKYDEAFAKYVAERNDKKSGRHPFADKEVLLAELKRAAIYMMCQDFERAGVMNMKSQPCGYPEINRRAASDECWDWYFWERAFDWRLMSFTFFDYFWNRMCDWPEKFDPGHGNFMFNAFLRSGMARLLVPVSPAMDGDVIWYLETGQKWGLGGTPPVNPADPRWVSVIEEVEHSRDCFQNDREGAITAILEPVTNALTNQVLLTGTDRYWQPLPLPGQLDQDAIDSDVGREVFIAGIAYRIVHIEQNDPLGHPYDAYAIHSEMQWTVTLERVFEGVGSINANTNAISPEYTYTIGAEYVGAPFRWQEPTNLVWLSDGGSANCLPSYPVEC